MYYPYFRGKQYELITIRENAPLFAKSGFVPIIEPVKKQPAGLLRSLDALHSANARSIVILNPQDGDHSGDADALDSLQGHVAGFEHVTCGLLLTPEMTVQDVAKAFGSCGGNEVALIHAGFTDAKGLSEALRGLATDTSIFLDNGNRRKLYEQYFTGQKHRVLVRNGFERRRNRDYPPSEPFSDLHATFKTEGMTGFGDYLIVGDEYLESGGPAYAVAIHLTYINSDKDNEMYIFHFVSDRQDTPTDPAGKFAEALAKLIAEADRPGTKLLATSAVAEFREFHERGHYPGLGYVKKLAMTHHIETLAHYFAG